MLPTQELPAWVNASHTERLSLPKPACLLPPFCTLQAGRNVALRSVRTKYVLVIDADFVPPIGTLERLNQQYRDALCAKPRVITACAVFTTAPVPSSVQLSNLPLGAAVCWLTSS